MISIKYRKHMYVEETKETEENKTKEKQKKTKDTIQVIWNVKKK